MRELNLIQECLLYTSRGWKSEGWLCYTEMNGGWTGPGQRSGSWRHGEHPGNIFYYFNQSTSEGELCRGSASGVTGAWCSKDFHGDQEAANADWEKRAGERDRKQSNGGKPKRINRRIKEILIWSERLLIFSSGLGMCAQPVISLETKKVECGESCWLCVVCVCVCC